MEFDTVKVQDSRIADITSKINYAVIKGAAQNTFQSFPSNSSSTSSVSFNISPPSESVVVSREVMVETDIKFQIRITDVPIGEKAFSYGENDALQAFPFSSLVSNLSASINNTNVSVNLQDTKDILLKMVSPRELGKYQDTCPTLVDSNYKVYADGGSNSELNGWAASGYDKHLLPRGTFPLKDYSVVRTPVSGSPDSSITSVATTDVFVISITVQTTEPVLLSPFVFGDSNHGAEQGFYGINQLNLTFNIDASMKRFWSTKSAYTYTFTLDPTTPFRSNILLNFLSTQPDDCINVKNVIPYLEYPRYITPITNTPSITAGTKSTITCQNIQLSKIPDLILIAARKPISSQTAKDSASFFPITQASINFNNQSGLMSNASTKDLYKTSVRNGVQQSWLEWSGSASSFDNASTSGLPQSIPTVGGILALSPAIDLSLNSTLANGSTGQFTLQVNLTVLNNGSADAAPEVIIIAVNSGILTTVAGSSSLQTGLLNSQIVLDASMKKGVSSSQVSRLVGGSLIGKIGALLRNAPKIASIVGDVLGSGVSSAGAVKSAGQMRKLDKFV